MSISCTGTLDTDLNGYPLCSGGDWVVDSFYPLLESLLSTPTEAEIQAAFMVGFGLPVMCYLTSWAYQTVIEFASRDRS